MVSWILKKILGSKNQREIKRLHPIVRSINELRRAVQDALRRRTAREDRAVEGRAGRDRRSSGTLARRLEEILPEAFAVVKNAARRLTERQETSASAISR